MPKGVESICKYILLAKFILFILVGFITLMLDLIKSEEILKIILAGC